MLSVMLPLVVSSTLLFFVGVAFCYFFVFGQVFSFIQSFAPKSITAAPDIEAYLSFVLTMFIAFGAAFEVPIAVIVLARMGIVSIEKLKDQPHGVDLGALQPCLPARLQTTNKRIDLAPAMLVADVDRLMAPTEASDYPFSLIGRRHLRDCNSWMHNYEVLVKGKNRCTVMVSEEDASDLGLANGQLVTVSSRAGAVELPCEVTNAIARGVVSIPHGYGHGRNGTTVSIANDHAGASI